MTWVERAFAITPLASQTRSKGPAAYGGAPLFGTGALDARVQTNDHRDGMIDWVCGLGAISLGYGHERVDKAMVKQISRGMTSLSLPTHLEIEVGEMLRDIIPCMQPDGMVRFVKTGSEACEAAVRIARKATGRDLVLTVGSGYHGWHSWFQAVKPDHPGVPDAYAEVVRSFVYNDLDSLERAQRISMQDADGLWHEIDCGRVAAVLLEPALFDAPIPGFLEGIRRYCFRTGAALIFDEMVTGFRLARAGGQERFGVMPDLACYGKGLANGMPLACVCGRKEWMRHADVVSGTFGGECLSLAAAQVVLQTYANQDVCGHMERIGRRLTDGLLALGLQWQGAFPAVGKLRFSDYDPERENRALGLFTQEMARCGILWHPRIRYVSLAHTEADVSCTLQAASEAVPIVEKAIETDNWSGLVTAPEQPFARHAHEREMSNT